MRSWGRKYVAYAEATPGDKNCLRELSDFSFFFLKYFLSLKKVSFHLNMKFKINLRTTHLTPSIIPGHITVAS